MILFTLLFLFGIPFFAWMLTFAENSTITRGDFITYWNRLSPSARYDVSLENWTVRRGQEIVALKREY
jgi:hypothetical protein